ncbi:MAG: NUDIX domain-containing protein [Lachnospiraceae bacterium]|nr:NUDIX domain-containing protein [Lachnospiraceae bacterium]
MELLDLYTQSFEKTGTRIIRGERIPEGETALIVFVCIFDAQGRMLLAQRHPAKSWGGLWDVAAAGGVQAGESSEQAARRELEEELGLRLPEGCLVKTMSVYYDGYTHDFYAAVHPVETQELTLQSGEVSAVCWADADRVRELLRSGEMIPVYEQFTDLLFAMQATRGIMVPEKQEPGAEADERSSR